MLESTARIVAPAPVHPALDLDAQHEGLILDTAALSEMALSDFTRSSACEMQVLVTQISARLAIFTGAGQA